jgi:hypothetical protein
MIIGLDYLREIKAAQNLGKMLQLPFKKLK